nr:hypothetical protein [Micromonospora marina]
MPADDPRAAAEPDWSGPSWNRPSWGDGWAPPWARTDEPPARRAEEPPVRGPEEPPARRTGEPVAERREWEDDSAAHRTPREDRAAEWSPEPVRPYEPARVEPPAAYEPPRPEPVRQYEPMRAEPAPGPEAARPYPPSAESEASWPYEPGAGPEPARRYEPGAGPEPARRYEPPAAPEPATEATRPFRLARGDAEPPHGYDRPSWAGPPVPVAPLGAPAGPAPTSAPPAPAGGYAPAPPTEAAATAPPTSGVPATSGAPRFDRTPASHPTSAPPYAARRSAPEPVPAADAVAEPRPEDPSPVLPQRVPSEPDVPVVPEPPAVEPSAETPELARIATHLRRDDEPAPLRERPEGFDVNAILDAVREVAGVRDAALRRTPAGAHSLRLDLADGADPAEVSRLVARLLQERMGLAAAPQNLPGEPAVPPPAPLRRRSARLDRSGEARAGENRAPGGQSAPGQARTDGTGAAQPEPGEARNGDETGGDEMPARTGVARPAANRSGDARFGADRATRPAEVPGDGDEPPRRRRQATHRGRAAVDETSLAAAPTGMSTGSPVTLGTSYSGGQMTTTETAPSRPLDTGGVPGPRVVIEHVLVSTFGLDATTEVRLVAGDRTAEGHATGPAVDGYVLRLCAVAAAAAVDELLGRAVPAGERGRCFVEHAAVVPFGNCEVATVVVLLVCDGWVEQLAGSALVAGDPRQAVVRATLAAVNRRLEALLS